MENEVEGFHEKQFRRIGMIEAYNEEIKRQMSQGAEEMVHRFQKEFNGDKIQADIFLKKCPALDAYEIKKFELQLQKAGQENKIAQTFLIGGVRKIYDDGGKLSYRQNRYTLKEGYNLLSGRPVFKRLVSRDGHTFEAWVKLDMKNKLANGNYETDFFTKNYQFNLEKTLKEYPIKELSNTKYTISLLESLHRGNLQLATFLHKDGIEEKLFVSPNIKMSSLKVYDENKKLIPAQQLVERNLISKELGEKLLQSQKFSQEQKQDLTKENKQKPKIS